MPAPAVLPAAVPQLPPACSPALPQDGTAGQVPVPFPDNLTEDNLLNTIIEEEISVKLIEKIQLLPEKCRNIMLMKIQGMDNKTIAATLHIREETVRSQIHRGKEILKNHFQMAYPALWIVPSFLESIFFF